MNYIKEMNAFYDWLEINELSPSAINLWYALMHINNKAGWAETFTVAESVLQVKTGLTDRTLRKVRNELKQKGRVDFISRKGGRAPIYNIVPFEATEKNSAVRAAVRAEGRSGDSAGGRSALIKLNETKQKRNKASSYTTYQEIWGVPSGRDQHMLASYTDDLGDDLVIEAMRRAQNESKNFSFAIGILKDWYRKGLATLEEVSKDDDEFEKRKKKYGTPKAPSQSRYGGVF
ncbi:DnaD domain protein [Halobacillus sp. KGW1]|uniref:DnaD domain protein n=1 Tax=Halobacillus sp. KGW1 TaxID=1793726 RepID=UPI0009EF2520|nr:DnaD domain protein [Halobacillus sp. KGW1]